MDIKFKIFDEVAITYKASKYYMKTARVVSVSDDGYCRVTMNDSNNLITYYHTHLIKISELVEIPSGEIIIVLIEDVIKLYTTGLVKFDGIKRFYFFDENDREQIDIYELKEFTLKKI